MKVPALAFALAACGSPASHVSGDAPAPTDGYVSTQSGALGMNDVTMLLPLPAVPASPTLLAMTGAGADLVPRALFQRLVATPGDVTNAYEEFQLVAVRFDLCDRTDAGACPPGLDGRVRMVFQPVSQPPAVPSDVALHVFYPIPAAELGPVIDELRALARLQPVPPAMPLLVRPVPSAAYADELRALILRYAHADRLVRLTLFAQNAQASAIMWSFRGVELHGSSYDDMMIPAIGVAQQRAILVGADPGYQVTPVVDAPAGLATALTSDLFSAATPAGRAQALAALTAVENPQLNSATTVQCVACHTATYLTAHRAATAGVDPATLPGRFTSTSDLSTAAGVSATTELSLRALGWFRDRPAISQRVVNDTAEVLAEIAQRFPPAP